MKDWEKILRQRLSRLEPETTRLNNKRAASVLIPIGLRQETAQHEILLTKRSDRVETHKGQISFPGGLFEVGDRDLLETALRETREEVGIEKTHIEVLGALDPVQTLRDVTIYPWVAKVVFPEKLIFNSDEVEKPLFLSIERLLVEGLKPVQVSVNEGGLAFKVASMGITCEKELIWGASAKILEQLLVMLR